MEAADHEFCKGLEYLFAARRVEGQGEDTKTRKALTRLAGSYRERANVLMAGSKLPTL